MNIGGITSTATFSTRATRWMDSADVAVKNNLIYQACDQMTVNISESL